MVLEKTCLNCGTEKGITKHHLTNLKPLRKFRNPPEWIPLCGKCHDAIESAKIFLKNEKTYRKIQQKAYKKGKEDLYNYYFKEFKNPMIVERNDKIIEKLEVKDE